MGSVQAVGAALTYAGLLLKICERYGGPVRDLPALRDTAEALVFSIRSNPLPPFKVFAQEVRLTMGYGTDEDLTRWLCEESRAGRVLAFDLAVALGSDRLTDAEVAAIRERYTMWILLFTQRLDAVIRDPSRVKTFLPKPPSTPEPQV